MEPDERLKHLLRLARIELAPDEVDGIAEDLGALLGYLARLRDADVDDEEWAPPIAPAASLRQDEPATSLERGAALSLAPSTQDGFFRVPRVVDDA